MTLDEILEQQRDERLPTPTVRRELRKGADLTQSDVASVLEVDRASVARYEAGRRSPRGETRRRYAKLLRRLAAEVFE